jgi:hypothetical protein
MISRKALSLSSGIASVLAMSVVAGAVSPAAWAEGWVRDGFFSDDHSNAPTRLESDFNYSFDAAPREARVPDEMMPFGDTYWPSNRGGIAFRWNQKDRAHQWIDPYLVEIAMSFPYYAPSKKQFASMDDDGRAAVRILFTEEEIALGQAFERLNAYDPRAMEAAPFKQLRARIRRDAQSVFNTKPPALAQLRTWTESQIAQLSPAEKFDLARGDYDYSMTQRVRGMYNARDAYWEGICHGWAPASVNEPEPQPTVFVNKDGIRIPLGSADVKAILDYAYGDTKYSSAIRSMGNMCKTNLTHNSNAGGGSCADVNAGAFHVVATNYIGLRGQAFVADLSRGHEIWNNPVYAYSFKVLGQSRTILKNSAKGTVRNVRVRFEGYTPSDDQRLPPQWEATTAKYDAEGNRLEQELGEVIGALDPTPFAGKYAYEKLHYEYWLDIDAAGQIIGGSWISDDRPDYIWMKNRLSFKASGDKYGLLRNPQFNKPAYSVSERKAAVARVKAGAR